MGESVSDLSRFGHNSRRSRPRPSPSPRSSLQGLDGIDMSKFLAGPVLTNIYDDDVQQRGHDGPDNYQRSESRCRRNF